MRDIIRGLAVTDLRGSFGKQSPSTGTPVLARNRAEVLLSFNHYAGMH
jgi:hypothetical protein